jgi:hypothetical protein
MLMHNFEFDLLSVEAQENGPAKKRSNDFIRDLIVGRDIVARSEKATVITLLVISRRRRARLFIRSRRHQSAAEAHRYWDGCWADGLKGWSRLRNPRP